MGALAGGPSTQARALTGRIARPAALPYQGGQSTSVDFGDFLGVRDAPTIAERTLTFASDVSGADIDRLDIGTESAGWIVYIPAGDAERIVDQIAPAAIVATAGDIRGGCDHVHLCPVPSNPNIRPI